MHGTAQNHSRLPNDRCCKGFHFKMSAVSPHQTFSSMEEYRAWKASQEGAATTPATTTTVSARTTTSGYATTATRGFSPRAYDTTVSSQVTRSVHTLGDGTVVEETTLTLHFFECVASAMDCNYIVIVDRSSSMRSGIWDGTKMATRWDEVCRGWDLATWKA